MSLLQRLTSQKSYYRFLSPNYINHGLLRGSRLLALSIYMEASAPELIMSLHFVFSNENRDFELEGPLEPRRWRLLNAKRGSRPLIRERGVRWGMERCMK